MHNRDYIQLILKYFFSYIVLINISKSTDEIRKSKIHRRDKEGPLLFRYKSEAYGCFLEDMFMVI